MAEEIGFREVITTVLDHYLKHHELILRKLVLAKQATEMAIEKVKDLSETQDPKELSFIWDEVIEIFANCGVSEDELFTIDDVLGNIPRAIKEPYDELLEKDENVQKLSKVINREEYERALKIVEHVQSQQNPMSGLEPEDYEISDDEDNNIVKAIKYGPRLMGKKS